VGDNFESLRSYLAEVAGISDSEWRLFARHLRERHLRKGAYFLTAGETDHRIGYVVSGLLRTFVITATGEEFTRSFAGDRDLVAAYAAALQGKPSHVTVEALEETTMLEYSYVDMLPFFARDASWERLGRIIAERYYIFRENHSLQLLSLSAEARYQAFLADFPELAGRVSQKHIAGYLGISPVSLSRIVHKERR
jgi:CRP-like cAMP-binding protein